MVRFDPKQPFNEIPLLPPEAEIDTKSILKKCIEARAALEGLRIAGDLIPNQTMLINIIPLLEAKDSSEIENIVTTTNLLFQFAQDEDSATDPATKEALRYRTALRGGFLSIQKKPLSTSTAVEICSALFDKSMDIRKVPGTALAKGRGREIIYTPPDREDIIRGKLRNWESFLHEKTEFDPLIRMAVGHYQFEAIHPFTDGNGRTGRILNLLYLVSEGLLSLPILYLSRYIIRHKADYYDLLLGVTQNQEWEPWILYILEAVTQTSKWTSEKIKAMRMLNDEARDYVRSQAPKIYSRELVDLIFVQPYCRIQNLVDEGIAKRETAAVYLKKLCEIGVLEEQKVGREKIFIHPKLMELLKSDEHVYEKYKAWKSKDRG